MRVAVGLLFAAFGVSMLAGAARGQDADPELARRGRDLFVASCAICHGDSGRGGEDGPPLHDASPALVDFLLRTGRMPLPNPDARMVRRQPLLDDDERAALVAFVRTIAADEPDIPSVDSEAGDVQRGRDVFEVNCAACHSASGRGIAVSQNDIAPALSVASPIEIAEAVRSGPGVMPRFPADVIGQQDLDSVVRYVEYLREREAPAGIAFGRSGPVTEGFVAWAVGLVSLVLAAYLLGEHRD
jgi:quinol---cytochrome-c reductase cytochrome c subunit